MTVLSDIIAELNTTLHTNTTKDITAAQLKTALIDAFTAILGAQLNPNQVAAISSQSAVGAHSGAENLVYLRHGQADEPGVYFTNPTAPNLVFPIGDFTLDRYLDFNGNMQTQTGYVVTNYFPVVPGTTITVSGSGDSSSFVWYDGAKSIVSVIAGAFATQAVTVPSNAYFARYSGQYFSNMQVLQGTHIPLPEQFRVTPASVNMFRPWTNKVWSFHGDSRVDASRSPWASLVASYHGVKDFYNMAQSGNGISQVLQEKTLYGGGPYTLKPAYWTDKDLVYSAMGINDVIGGTTLGTVDDATTATTFYGFYKKFIETVLTNNPYCRIVLSTLLYTSSATRAAVQSYNTAIRNLCQYYSLHLFDNGERGSQFSPFTFSALSSDGLHPGSHVGFIGTVTGATPLQAYEVGSVLSLGSTLAAYLMTVYPTTFIGDPLSGFTFHPTEFDPNPAG